MLTGVWANSYGSTMVLREAADGYITGSYRSHTGSTGTYHVAGHAGTEASAASAGRSAALSILWRPIEAGEEEPAWHWASALGGQLIVDNGAPSLHLLHALVATVDWPEAGIPAGTWLDKLIYTPVPEAAAPWVPVPGGPAGTGDPVDGLWIAEDNADTTLELSVSDTARGVVAGSLRMQGSSLPVSGFTDTWARAAGIPRQSVSLSVAHHPAAGSLSLAGSLEYRTDRLGFTVFASRGTGAASSYVQTAVSALCFQRR